MVEIEFTHRASGDHEYLVMRSMPPATERDFGRSKAAMISLSDAQTIANEVLEGRRSGRHGDYDWQVMGWDSD